MSWIELTAFACGLLVGISAVLSVGSKAGYRWPWLLLLFVPGLNLIIFLVFAFSEWPIEKRLEAILEGGPDAWSRRIAERTLDLKHPQPEIRREAAGDLAEFGSRSASIVPALGALVRDPDPEVSKSATQALSILASNAKETLHEYDQIRQFAE
jgi:hypothetical protein